MTWLCTKLPTKEWSGVLFWTLESGSFDEGNAQLVAEYIYLFDIGSGAYTEYDVKAEQGKELVAFFMKNPQYATMYRGKLHSHNTMSSFHSGTDNNDLKDQIMDEQGLYNYYVSLVVNNRNEFDLSVAFKAETVTPKTIITYKNLLGQEVSQEYSSDQKSAVVYYYKGNVEAQALVDQTLIDCFEKLNTKAAPVSTITQYPRYEKPVARGSVDVYSPTLFPDEKEGYLDFLKSVLPSSKNTLEEKLDSMENNMEEDDSFDTYNRYFDRLKSNLKIYKRVKLDSPLGQDFIFKSISFIQNYNLTHPTTVELVVDLLSEQIKFEEDYGWKTT